MGLGDKQMSRMKFLKRVVDGIGVWDLWRDANNSNLLDFGGHSTHSTQSTYLYFHDYLTSNRENGYYATGCHSDNLFIQLF